MAGLSSATFSETDNTVRVLLMFNNCGEGHNVQHESITEMVYLMTQ